MSALLTIAEQFRFPGVVDQVQPFGSGIINDTYVVTFTNPGPVVFSSCLPPRSGKRAILQRINRQVFPQPVQVIHNLQLLLQHAAQQEPDDQADQYFLLPQLYATHAGDNYYRDAEGDIWRAMTFIEGTESFDTVESLRQATEAGTVLGTFHQRVHNLPIAQLYDTLPGFHITPNYLRHYARVIADPVTAARAGNNRDSGTDNEAWRYCEEVIAANRDLACVLVNATPPLTTRVMHGDPKLNNMLFDTRSGRAVSIIDLDTVKPGLIHYDIADCLRSCCNRGGEMPGSTANIEFDTGVCRAILEAYVSAAASFLETQDFDYLFPAIQLLPFELGLRFYTDYLQGDRYFKVNSPNDNLNRAVTQLELLQSIQRQQAEIRDIIEDIKKLAVSLRAPG
ncbi:MAG TPA: aminoglycoside phosphotransferase family protein [Gammaproteobacteria bacterium]